jgi:hypothetical protein
VEEEEEEEEGMLTSWNSATQIQRNIVTETSSIEFFLTSSDSSLSRIRSYYTDTDLDVTISHI